MQNMSSAMRRLVQARERVVRRSEWFGGIAYAARLAEKPMGTMCTDGINIFADPDFVRDNDRHIEGVFLHELLHCAMDHVGRQQWREHDLWNIACDYAINPLVVKYFTLPPNALLDPRFDRLRAERIYDVLEQERQDRKGKEPPGNEPTDEAGNEQGEGDSGERPGEGKGGKPGEPKEQSGRMIQPTPEEIEKNRDEFRRAVKRATDKAEAAGNLPSEIKRALTELFPSEKLDWRNLLDDMARNSREAVNTSWARPNRRWLGQDIIKPGPETTKVHKLVICFDCSGSVSDVWTNEMKAEACNVIEQKLADEIVLIATDTDVCNYAEVTTVEEIKDFEVNNGGGTDFDKAMEKVREIDDAMGCVFLTDMQTNSFGDDPGMPVVWVDWTGRANQTVPFGRVCAL